MSSSFVVIFKSQRCDEDVWRFFSLTSVFLGELGSKVSSSVRMEKEILEI